MSEAPEKRIVPKLGAPRISRTALIWGVLAILAIGGTAGAGAYYKYVYKRSPETVALMGHTGEIAQADWVTAPAPEPEPEPVSEPEPESPSVPVQEPDPVQAPRVTTPRPQLSANDLFRTVPRANRSQEIAQINNSRRGAVGIKATRDLYGTVGRDEYLMSQKQWDEEQTIASYPIDMSRVIPVYMNIPATLVNEINSELPGKVVAQVNQNIYGGRGRKILIPAGSMATGYYAPLEKEGQERLMITWVRIDTPTGINIHVANAEMADAMGRAGITGEIDHKYFDKYGIPLLTTAIQAVAAYSVPVDSSGQAAMVESFGSSLATMGQQALDENLDIAPTVTIKAGEHILISPMKDIWFKEPVKRTIQAVAVEN